MAANGHDSHAATHDGVGHVVPLTTLFAVLGGLLFLTFLTVAVTWFDLGDLNLVVALLIAVVKASLVLLFFMHLRWDRPFNAIVLIFSLVLVMLFVGLALLDAKTYEPSRIPGYAPRMQQTQ